MGVSFEGRRKKCLNRSCYPVEEQILPCNVQTMSRMEVKSEELLGCKFNSWEYIIHMQDMKNIHKLLGMFSLVWCPWAACQTQIEFSKNQLQKDGKQTCGLTSLKSWQKCLQYNLEQLLGCQECLPSQHQGGHCYQRALCGGTLNGWPTGLHQPWNPDPQPIERLSINHQNGLVEIAHTEKTTMKTSRSKSGWKDCGHWVLGGRVAIWSLCSQNDEREYYIYVLWCIKLHWTCLSPLFHTLKHPGQLQYELHTRDYTKSITLDLLTSTQEIWKLTIFNNMDNQSLLMYIQFSFC